MKLKLLPIAALILFLLSCSSVSNIETFYIGDGGIQYYILPVEYKGAGDNKSSLEMDYIYRHFPDSGNPVRCNFTVKTKQGPIYKIDKGIFFVEKQEYQINGLEMLYREIDKKEIRYTGFIDYNVFNKAFSENISGKIENYYGGAGLKDILSIRLATPEKEYIFIPGDDFVERAEQIQREILKPVKYD